MYIGHKREDGGEQPLKAHLDGVALLAATFAEGFGASKHAERAASNRSRALHAGVERFSTKSPATL